MNRSVLRGLPGLVLLALLAACEGTPTAAPSTPPAPTATFNVVPPTATIAQNTPPTATAGAVAPTNSPAPSAGATAPGAGDGQINQEALYHNSRDPLYRTPGGAVPAGTQVTLRLKTAAGDLTGAAVRIWDNTAQREQLVPMALERHAGGADFWKADVPTPAGPTVLWYHFIAQDGSTQAAYQDDPARDGGPGVARALANANDYSINAYDPHWTIPAWMQDAVVYQIFPDRFNNGDPGNDRPAGQPIFDETTTTHAWGELPSGNDEFYGGDLQGVIAKLDYLQSLGVTVIYFNPIFDADSNHAYDTRDYTQIASWFGTTQTFDTLVAQAAQRNIHVILDGVFNHTSSDSPFFDRYHHYPNDGAYEAQTSPYFSWYRFSGWPDSYFTFGNYNRLPQLQEIDAVKDYFFRAPDSIAQRWLREGVAGWRLDAADRKTDRFWREFRASVRGAFPDALIIGEFWQNATTWLSGDEWDGVMNYRFRDAAWDFFSPHPAISADQFDTRLASIREDYPPNALISSLNLIDSHDTERALHVMGGDKNRLRLLALLQFTSLGAPTVYYGDEAGLDGGKDPDDRRTYPWGQEDPALIQYYQLLGKARHQSSALRIGATRTLLTHNDNRLYAYARHDDHGTALVAYNLGAADQTLILDVHDLAPDGTTFTDWLNNDAAYTVQGGQIQVRVPKDWGALLLP